MMSTPELVMDTSFEDPYKHLGAWAQRLDDKSRFPWTKLVDAGKQEARLDFVEEDNILRMAAAYPIPELEVERIKNLFEKTPPRKKSPKTWTKAAKKNRATKRYGRLPAHVPSHSEPFKFSSEEAAKGWHPELAQNALTCSIWAREAKEKNLQPVPPSENGESEMIKWRFI